MFLINVRFKKCVSKVILENSATLMFVPDCNKNKNMCNKTVDNYLHALDFIPHCYKTQKMSNKAVDTYSSAMKLISECYNT